MALANLGAIAFNESDYEEAGSLAREALTGDPANPVALQIMQYLP